MPHLDEAGLTRLWSKMKGYTNSILDNLNIPTKTSELTDDVGFAKKSSLDSLEEYVDAQINDLKAQGNQQTINFAQGETVEEALAWLEENGDTTKTYVLPDGFIYAYKYTEVIVDGSTNHADMSIADWGVSKYINSSGSVANATATDVTNYIPAKAGDTIRFKNVVFNGRIALYKEDKSYIGVMSSSTFTSGGTLTTGSDGVQKLVNLGSTTPTGSPAGNAGQTGYVRFTVNKPTGTPNISVNEEIKEGSTTSEWVWANTGHAFVPADYEEEINALEIKVNKNTSDITGLQNRITTLEEDGADELPEYWQTHLNSKIATIKELLDAGGVNCFAFPFVTDIHYESNLGRKSPLLIDKIMKACGLPYALCGGDSNTRHGANHNLEYLKNEWLDIDAMFEPILDRLLIQDGNHDGSGGIIDANSDGVADDINADGVVDSYDKNVYNFTPEQKYSRIRRKASLINGVKFDETGNAFYVDDKTAKVRYIMLNSHNNQYEENTDGSAKYNNMTHFRFGQAQYDFLINDALATVPEGYYVIPCCHVPLDRTQEYVYWGGARNSDGSPANGSVADCMIMQRLLNAYKKKTTYNGTFGGTASDGHDAVSVSANFTNAKGDLLFMVCGHTHADNIWMPTLIYNSWEKSEFPIVTSRSDGRVENTSALQAEREAGTITEQSFDVYVVNTKTRNCDIVKIGAGSDRSFTF